IEAPVLQHSRTSHARRRPPLAARHRSLPLLLAFPGRRRSSLSSPPPNPLDFPNAARARRPHARRKLTVPRLPELADLIVPPRSSSSPPSSSSTSRSLGRPRHLSCSRPCCDELWQPDLLELLRLGFRGRRRLPLLDLSDDSICSWQKSTINLKLTHLLLMRKSMMVMFTRLFPKERNGTWRGLGLLVGGSNSRNLAEIKAELQDTRNENSKLWSMVETLMKNQSDLQQQHNELKQMWLASQDHKPSDSFQKNEEQPREPMEDMEVPEDHVKVASVLSRNIKISKAQAKVSLETDNHEKATSLSSRNSKRSEVFNETEQEAASPQQLSMKRQIAQPKEKTPPRVLRQKTKVSATNKSLHKKSRKFQTPLQKDDVREIITRGTEVGLVTSQSDIMVALATVISTSYKSRSADGKIHHDCVEVLVNSVFNKTRGLPYPEGKIILLSSAIGHCIPWPRNDLVPISVKAYHQGHGK
ncbi:hypothetical protein EJB05_52907, partial [Eragrostis curvula]